jgi:hypothetical protein
MKSLSPKFAGSFGLAVRRNGSRLAVLFAAFFVIFAAQALAQEATILGTVTDPTGAAVPNAPISITNAETGLVRDTVTNGDGQYVAPNLQIGTYTLRVTATGFKATEQKNVVLAVGDRTRLDFKLQVGSAQEQVTVEANAVAVQTDSSAVDTVINGKQVSSLGINGRSLYSLFALAPGASSLQTDRVGFTPVSGDSTVSINGQRSGHNLQLIDGGENLDRGGSSGSVMPSLDSIAEFRNMTSNYSAEYGLSSAATISTVIKSGTRQFHASAWEYFRNNALNTRNYFNPAPQKVAELRYNIYGFNLGGQVPAWKSHPTFFFYNQEWRSEVDGGLLNVTVPYTSTYGGNFTSNLPANVLDVNKVAIPFSGLHVPCQYQLSATQQALFAGQTFSTPLIVGGSPTCSANSKNPINAVAGVPSTQPVFSPFVSNTLPFLDPNAQALLVAGGKYGGIFPAPNNGNQFQGGNNSPTKLTEEIARVDHTFNSKFSIFGHWVSEQISQTYGTSQWSGDNTPSIGNTFGNPSYSAVVHTTYVISPTLLNEASFNYNGNRINIIPAGLISAPSAFQFNRLFTGPNVDNRIPSIALGGSTGTNYTVNWMPWINKADDYQVRDDISWTKGAHQLKMGASWAIYKKIQDYFANTQGNFSFSGGFTGNDFADYLLGYGQSYNEDAVKSSGHWNNVSYAAYIQDNWRVNSRLTLNLGLRWDGVPHTYEANQQSANFYPNLYNTSAAATFDSNGNICSPNSVPLCAGGSSPGLGTSPNPILAGLQFYTNGIGIGGVNGIPKGLVQNHWAAFGPRIGFAYDVTGQGKTVIRGGFGIMYERIQGNDMYNGATNTPFDAHPVLNNVSLSNPGVNVTTGDSITSASLPVLPVGQTGIAYNNYKLPVSYQYSMGLQQALGARAVLSVSYVGSQARHQNDYLATNLPPQSLLPAMVAAGSLDNTKVQYLGFGGIRMAENEANAHYNALQVDVHGQVTKTLQLQAGYTASKSVDATTASGSGGDLNNVTNPYLGWRYDSGPGLYDRTNVFFVNFVYDIPIFNNSSSKVLKATLGGWSLSGIITMESGAPLNLGVNGTTAASVISNSGTRPNLTGSIKYPKTAAAWFDPSVFSAPACTPGGSGADCYGNLGHDALRGPGRDNWNMTLAKTFAFTERFHMRFSADAFNMWNHTQFKGDANNGGISTNFGSSNFGAVTSAFDGRQFQLALKLIY